MSWALSRSFQRWFEKANPPRPCTWTVGLAPGFKVKGFEPESECKACRGWVRIPELADKVGVPVSTVRYYERIGLLAELCA